MKSLHFTVLLVGFLLMVAVIYPLGVFAYEAMKNPDKAIVLDVEDQGDRIVFRIVYNVNVSVKDAVVELNLTLDNGTVIRLSDSDTNLQPGDALTLVLEKDRLDDHNVASSSIKLSGVIGGVFPITIELGQEGGG